MVYRIPLLLAHTSLSVFGFLGVCLGMPVANSKDPDTILVPKMGESGGWVEKMGIFGEPPKHGIDSTYFFSINFGENK